MDRKEELNLRNNRKDWSASDLVHPDTTKATEKGMEMERSAVTNEADRLKEMSKDIRQDLKDNYKEYKKEMKDSDHPLADDMVSSAKEESKELRDKIKKGIDHQRDKLLDEQTGGETINNGVYLQDPLYGGAFFPDPTFGGPQSVEEAELIRQRELQKRGEDLNS